MDLIDVSVRFMYFEDSTLLLVEMQIIFRNKEIEKLRNKKTCLKVASISKFLNILISGKY
mgnify:CR=1 FL=1